MNIIDIISQKGLLELKIDKKDIISCEYDIKSDLYTIVSKGSSFKQGFIDASIKKISKD